MSEPDHSEVPEHEADGGQSGDLPDEASKEDLEGGDEARSGLWYRGTDGEWHEITAEPKLTGDPELDALWAMSFSSFEKVLDDESHPLHRKAKQVAAEITKPLAEALSRTMKPFSDNASSFFSTKAMADSLPNFDFASLYPEIDTSWISKLATRKVDFPNVVWQRMDSPPLPPPDLHRQQDRVIGLSASEPPDATMAEIGDFVVGESREMLLQFVDLQRELLDQAKTDSEAGKEALEISRKALDATKSGVKEAKGSKRAAWVAAIVAGLGVLATVVFGTLQLPT